MASVAQKNALTVRIDLAASATTDGMEATLSVRNARGEIVPGVYSLEAWISESASGAGLTADSYSGTVTASTGAILTAYTAKKHFSVVTASSGIAVLLAVDSANPTDQYVCARAPGSNLVCVSAVSGTNWQGAA